MIDKKSRRVVIINNIQSDTIDQAIFILKSDKAAEKDNRPDADISVEAQKIIDNYIAQVERLKNKPGGAPSKQKKHSPSKKPVFLLPVMLTAIFMLTIFFIITYWG